MDTTQLQCCIECDPLLRQRVLGVFAADQLSKVIPSNYPYGFIANTDIQSKRGQHWCAFYANEPGEAEFFDSYGFPSQQYSQFFSQWMQEHSILQKYNKVQIQSEYSSVCGLYCLFYLRQRLRGWSMNNIVHSFNTVNRVNNDSFIYTYMSGVFSHCTSNCSISNQICIPLIKNMKL